MELLPTNYSVFNNSRDTIPWMEWNIYFFHSRIPSSFFQSLCVYLYTCTGPSPDTMQVYTWSELKILLCFFAKCILNETIGAEDSPLHEFQHRLLPHIQSLLEIKVHDCTYKRLRIS